MSSLALLKPASVATLLMVRCGFLLPGVVTLSHAWAAPAAPSSTQASLKKVPASTSAWVMVWLAVQVIAAPGASDEPLTGSQTRFGAFGSVTVTAPSVVFPSLVAVIV